jgi:hypothetical protein
MTQQETTINFDGEEKQTIQGVLLHVIGLMDKAKGWKCSGHNKSMSKKDINENITRYRQLISKVGIKDDLVLDDLELDTIRGAMLYELDYLYDTLNCVENITVKITAKDKLTKEEQDKLK